MKYHKQISVLKREKKDAEAQLKKCAKLGKKLKDLDNELQRN